MKKTLLLILPLLLLCACGDGKYEVTPDTVCYTYWTFSFGTRHDTLPEVDAKTFEAVKNWLGRDVAHVYYQNRLIVGCDPATLRAHKKPLCSDKNDYYYKGQPMHVADVDGFKVLKQDDLVLWAKDSRYAYYDTVRIQVDDVKAFHLIEWCVATDNIHVYCFGERVPDADPKTYESLEGGYAKDRSHVWYLNDPVIDADVESFKVTDGGVGYDKNGLFKGVERVKPAAQEEPQGVE